MLRCAVEWFTRVAVALSCAAAVTLAVAKPVTATFKDVQVTFTKGKAADPNSTSVYVKFEGGLNQFNATVRADGFTVTPVGAGGAYQLTAKAGVSIADGGVLTLRVKTNAPPLNGVRVGDVIFQDGAGKVLANGKATGGALVGDPFYFVYNDLEFSTDLKVENLHFYFDHAPIDPDLIDPGMALSGSFVSAADATLNGLGSFKDYPVPPIADGLEFYVQGDVTRNGVRVAQFVDGFSVSSVPEPAPALLMLLGPLGWLASRRLRPPVRR